MITLGIDAGTQSLKALVYDSEKKEILATSSSPIALIAKDGGVREQEASWWIDALSQALSSIDEDIRRRVEAIGISGQQHGLVLVDKDGCVLAPVKLWCDTSTSAECKEITSSYGGEERLIENVGNPILAGYTASKILYFKKNYPDIFAKSKYIMLPHDYLNYYLTGVFSMERGDASGTGLMDIRKGVWDEELCRSIDKSVMGKLPRTIDSPRIIGRIKKEIAARFSLSENVVVVSGGGDNMMSAIGSGVVDDGTIAMSLGTSGTLFASSSKPIVDKKKRLAAFCSSHGTWLPLLCTMNCTVATEEMRHYLNLDVREFDDLASSAKTGSDGLFFIPFLNGERVPDYPNGSGTLFGIRQGNLNDGNLARSTLEGVTYSFLLGLDAFKESGIIPRDIILTGGGAKSGFWRQLVADMTGCDIKVLKVGETAAFGSALQALALKEGRDIKEVAKEHISFDDTKSAYPDSTMHKEYEGLYKKWLRFVDVLEPVFS